VGLVFLSHHGPMSVPWKVAASRYRLPSACESNVAVDTHFSLPDTPQKGGMHPPGVTLSTHRICRSGPSTVTPSNAWQILLADRETSVRSRPPSGVMNFTTPLYKEKQ